MMHRLPQTAGKHFNAILRHCVCMHFDNGNTPTAERKVLKNAEYKEI